jgi:hypothetical protein
VHRQVESAQAHFAKSDNFRNIPVHAYKTDYYYNNPSFSPQEGAIKTLKINSNESTNFLNIAKSTIGAFQVQVDDNKSKNYFVISIAFKH